MIYVGITSNLNSRLLAHKSKIFKGYTKKYNITSLVYYESYLSPLEAIQREKQLKRWRRKWKTELIETNNPKWRDLSF
ncbi:GIY-YIG nuclease family protein [Candidatus Nomurabacteria bacterium]|nr:GIY-YIG nuclease family protein [Candidatus Nomurabacteria bacterium]